MSLLLLRVVVVKSIADEDEIVDEECAVVKLRLCAISVRLHVLSVRLLVLQQNPPHQSTNQPINLFINNETKRRKKKTNFRQN